MLKLTVFTGSLAFNEYPQGSICDEIVSFVSSNTSNAEKFLDE